MASHPCRLYHVSEEHLKWLTSARDDVSVPRGLLRRAVTEGNQLQQHNGLAVLQGNCLAACWAGTALLVFHASGGGWHQLHLTVLEQGPASPIQVDAALKVLPRMRCVQKQWPWLHVMFSNVITSNEFGHLFCNACCQLPPWNNLVCSHQGPVPVVQVVHQVQADLSGAQILQVLAWQDPADPLVGLGSVGAAGSSCRGCLWVAVQTMYTVSLLRCQADQTGTSR